MRSSARGFRRRFGVLDASWFRLLETYEEARLLFEAKGWGMAKAAEHLAEMRKLKRCHISHPKLSKKTAPGSKFPIEPEVADLSSRGR